MSDPHPRHDGDIVKHSVEPETFTEQYASGRVDGHWVYVELQQLSSRGWRVVSHGIKTVEGNFVPKDEAVPYFDELVEKHDLTRKD